MLQLYVSEFSNFQPLFTKNGCCCLLSHFRSRGNLIVHCSNSVIIIIKTGNWDFGKLKGGDNEFHSLRTYQTAIERASNRRLLAPPDHTLHCGQNGIPKMATKKLKSTLMCKGVFNYSKNRTFVLQFANTK